MESEIENGVKVGSSLQNFALILLSHMFTSLLHEAFNPSIAQNATCDQPFDVITK